MNLRYFREHFSTLFSIHGVFSPHGNIQLRDLCADRSKDIHISPEANKAMSLLFITAVILSR